jgi:hypothetical protein
MTASIRCNTLRLGCSCLHARWCDACARSCSVPIRKSWGNAEIKMTQQLDCHVLALRRARPARTAKIALHSTWRRFVPEASESFTRHALPVDSPISMKIFLLFFSSIAISGDPDGSPTPRAVVIVHATKTASKFLWRVLALMRGVRSSDPLFAFFAAPLPPLFRRIDSW